MPCSVVTPVVCDRSSHASAQVCGNKVSLYESRPDLKAHFTKVPLLHIFNNASYDCKQGNEVLEVFLTY